MSRRSREELRQTMIEAGCELLARRGLAFDPPSLTYANVFQHLEATRGIRLHRSQVHGRIWESQDHYRTDVVIETIDQVLPGSDEVDALVADLAKDTGLTNMRALIEGWVAASIGVSRLGADQDLGLDLFVASQALSDEDSATAAHISQAATAHLGERMRYNEQRYDAVATKLGLDFVNDLDMDRDDAVRLLARNSSALVEGARLMESLDHQEPEMFDVLGDSGEPQTIDAATLGLIVFVEELFDLEN